MNEEERRALEQAAEQVATLGEELWKVVTALRIATTDNAIERHAARLSTITAVCKLQDAEFALRSAVARLT